MKRLIKLLIKKPLFARAMQNFVLNLHSKTYILSGLISSTLNNGIHPKHRILKYKEWFLDNIQKDWVVLDVGCNTGMMPELMSKKARFVYGIEIDEKLIKEARKNRQRDNVEFILADATTFDYSQIKAIDCVTLSNVLEHIDARVDFLKKLIKQIKWNDKKRFLIRVPMVDRDWITIYKKELGLEYRLDRTHFVEYTYEQFEKELNQAGIRIVNYHIRFGEIYAVCEVDPSLPD